MSATSIQEFKNPALGPDMQVNMFSLKGFELAQRVAKAFSTSDAVPVAFRMFTVKKQKNAPDLFIENTAAIGNCLVAIEVAQAVGMSVTAVMQNADVIQGKLRWSGKFVIAAINASRRFSPLRFRMRDLGQVTVEYKETYWENNTKLTRVHKVDLQNNIECVCWAYVMDKGRPTSEIVESVPVSMKMAVEEGWYTKTDSKWKTELKHLMLQYRSGTFFGNIHAPDVVMGMGRTSEEAVDIYEAVQDGQGGYSVDVESLKAGAQPSDTATTQTRATEATDTQTGEIIQAQVELRPAQGFTPSAEEIAAIHEREMAEAAANTEAPQSTAPRGRARQQSFNAE